VDFAVSAKGQWLVIGDAKGWLSLFETRKGDVADHRNEAMGSVGAWP
jgi:hypothetical protein